MEKFYISLSLSKKGLTLKDLIKSRYTSKEIELGNANYKCYLVYKYSESKPKFVDFFGAVEDDFILIANNSSNNIALIISGVKDNILESRSFIITFGSGRYFINDNTLESNFGEALFFNLVEPNSFKMLNTKNLDNGMSNITETKPNYLNVYSFYSTSRNKLFIKAKGKARLNDAGVLTDNIENGFSFKFFTNLKLNDLIEKLPLYLRLYKDDSYKEKYKELLKFNQVKNKNLLKELNKYSIDNFFNESSLFFGYPDKLDENFLDNLVSVSVFRQKIDSFDKLKLKAILDTGHEIYSNTKFSFKTENGNKYVEFSELIYGEVFYKNKIYFATNGNWYIAASDFVADINNTLNEYRNSQTIIKDFYEGSESDFNEKIAKENEDFILFDKKLFNNIELCDLYSKSNYEFIHVKIYRNSESISHLISQVNASINCIRKDSNFRNYLKKVIGEDSLEINKFKFTLAIITDKKSLLDFPILSKINLAGLYVYLKEQYGIDLYLNLIRKNNL